MVRRLQKISIKASIIISCLLMFLTSMAVYMLSPDSHVKVLSCSNNYYFTDQEIYQMADIDTDTIGILTPSFLLEKRVESDPFIESCSVSKYGNKVAFSISEKVIIGYYVKSNKNYALCIDGSSIEIDQDHLSIIVHFPLLSNLSKKQRKLLCEQFNDNKDILTREVIEKIAEIVPYKTSFDKNMFKMTMQDGNIVYTNASSIKMMAKYQSMLTKLKGESVCLVFDSEHSAIEKIDCEDLSDNKKDDEKDDDTTNEADQTTDDTTTDQTTETTVEDNTNNDLTTDNTYDGYTYDESTGLYYNETTGLYMDDYGYYYYYDYETQSFQYYQ